MRALLAVLAISLALAGCAESSGERASGFLDAAVAKAYIPLSQRGFLDSADAAATEVAPGIAATNAHNYELIDPKRYIGPVRGYDLIFFKSDGPVPPPLAKPYAGEQVRAYGQGIDRELRTAEGRIIDMTVKIPPAIGCAKCAKQTAFIYDAPAGPGFSGGPVVDAKTGALVGITFGYDDRNGKRIMYAYDVDLILAALKNLQR